MGWVHGGRWQVASERPLLLDFPYNTQSWLMPAQCDCQHMLCIGRMLWIPSRCSIRVLRYQLTLPRASAGMGSAIAPLPFNWLDELLLTAVAMCLGWADCRSKLGLMPAQVPGCHASRLWFRACHRCRPRDVCHSTSLISAEDAALSMLACIAIVQYKQTVSAAILRLLALNGSSYSLNDLL
jgi:hypothetical protein